MMTFVVARVPRSARWSRAATSLARLAVVGTVLIALGSVAPRAALAQDDYVPVPEFGLFGGYQANSHKPLAGARATVPIGKRLDILILFDREMGSAPNTSLGGVNFIYRGGADGGYYGGGGLAINFDAIRDLTYGGHSAGLSLVAGSEFRRFGEPLVRPFVEGQFISFGSHTALKLLVGFNFALERSGM
jgi:hypothetical protein